MKDDIKKYLKESYSLKRHIIILIIILIFFSMFVYGYTRTASMNDWRGEAPNAGQTTTVMASKYCDEGENDIVVSVTGGGATTPLTGGYRCDEVVTPRRTYSGDQQLYYEYYYYAPTWYAKNELGVNKPVSWQVCTSECGFDEIVWEGDWEDSFCYCEFRGIRYGRCSYDGMEYRCGNYRCVQECESHTCNRLSSQSRVYGHSNGPGVDIVCQRCVENQGETCGNCGTIDCDGNCINQGVCAIGEEITENCGVCGTRRTKVCNGACQWEESITECDDPYTGYVNECDSTDGCSIRDSNNPYNLCDLTTAGDCGSELICDDNIDNDCDSFIDRKYPNHDPDCCSGEICDNLIDDDCDGAIDLLDSDCCELTNAYWGVIEVGEGTLVTAIVEGSGQCNSQIVSIEVLENDTKESMLGIRNPPDKVKVNPAPAIFQGNTAQAEWIAEYQEDGYFGLNDPPEYYFNASIYTQSLLSNNDLTVLESLEQPPCIKDGFCVLGCCPEDPDCGSGLSCNAGDGCKANCDNDPDCGGATCNQGDACLSCTDQDPDCDFNICNVYDGFCVLGCTEAELSSGVLSDPDCGSCGATCQPGDGCTARDPDGTLCEAPDPDCGGASCNEGDACLYGCFPPDPDCSFPKECKLNNAYWSNTCIKPYSIVNLTVTGNAKCGGQVAKYRVFKRTDKDELIAFPEPAQFIGQEATTTWQASYEGYEEASYYFIAEVNETLISTGQNYLKICDPYLDLDCDCVLDENDLCLNTPYGMPVDEFGCAIGQESCLADYDCSKALWQDCNEEGLQTRDITQCVYEGDNQACIEFKPPAEKQCLTKEAFTVFSFYNVIVVLILLIIYYLYKKRKYLNKFL